MIFLDIGAHEGHTLEEVTKPAWPFTRIYAFEPMPDQYETLRARFGSDERVSLLAYGLSNKSGAATLYGSNAGLEASLYADKIDVDETIATECLFVRASAFFEMTLNREEPVFVKLNCEGAEVPILDDLIDSGEIWKATNVMIDFDIRKVPGKESEAERILARLAEIGFDRYCLCEDVMHGATHQDRIAAWLRGVV